MVSDDEILSSRIIGFIKPQGDNARVNVIGFKTPNNDYEILNDDQKKKLFRPKGFVFAPKYEKRTDLNLFIEFNVRESLKKVSDEDDFYVIDYYKYKIKPIPFPKIICLNKNTELDKGFLDQDEIFPLIKNKNLSDKDNFFLKFNNRLYGLFIYNSTSQSIEPKKGKETNRYDIDDYIKRKCFKFNEEEEYYFGNIELVRPFCSIDCMSDKQLDEWFKAKMEAVIKSEPFLKLKKDNYQAFSQHFIAVDEKLEEVRLERIKGKINTLKYNFAEIKSLLEPDSPLTQLLKLFRANQQAEITELQTKNDWLKNEKEKCEEELSKLKSAFNAKSESLQKDFDEKKKTLEDEISETERKHKAVKDNYDLLVESIKLQTSLKSQPATEVIALEPVIFEAEGKTFSQLYEDDGYSFDYLLREKLKNEDLSETLKEQLNRKSELFSYKASFIPSVSWAYFYAKAVGNSRLFTIHVEHDWLHYKDFINNGLLDVFKSCDENKEVNHILVFDSLNLTQPECGLKPLLDTISGYSLILPVFNKPLPNNLKIFATILPFENENKIGLPLNKESFVNWGQISNPEDKLTISANFMDCEKQTGYFEPKDLEALNPKEWNNNGYFAE